jgi:CCR4-NOT transcription complex subunit 7/8
MYAQESIDLLAKSGIMFQKNLENGIDPMHFAELLTSSGVVLIDKVTWISFHSSYDFGYLIKLLTNRDLPNTEAEFLELLKIFFPNVFDIKYLMKSCRNLKGGLEEVARQLEVSKLFIFCFSLILYLKIIFFARLKDMVHSIKQVATVYLPD